jgi:phage terminase large subunit GpA-like protein
MIEPMDVLEARGKQALIFIGPAQSGKALDLETELPTPTGWTTMGNIRRGDVLFDERGKPCSVTFVTEIQHNRPCYQVTFSDGSTLVADADHQWAVERFFSREPHWRPMVMTTADIIKDGLDHAAPNQRARFRFRVRNTGPIECPDADLPIDPYVGTRQITDITPVATRPVRCIQVDSPSHVYLAGRGMIPTHNTMALIDCWIGHVITSSPSDMMVIQATQSVARDYERDRWRKLVRHSPDIKALLSAHGHDDNTYDKTIATGDTIYLKWPSENELQGKSLRRMALTDYDRMPQSIGGQGSPFELARKRTRKYRSLAMTLVESSPGHEQTDPQWRPATPHDASPARGILSLYRLGDRRRLYWPCPHCADYFMSPAGVEGFVYEVQEDLLGHVAPETLGAVAIACPHCGSLIAEDQRPAMLAACRWVPDHCTIDRHGTITGTPPDTNIASFWLHGVHAAYQSWRDLVYGYLQAYALFQATHDEEPLRTVVMQDLAAPYISQARDNARRPTELEARAERAWRRGTVPDGVRWLTALVDTQGRHWSVMIVGRGVANERWVIDRFEIRHSRRADDSGNLADVSPAAYLEDWDLLTERVVCGAYPLVGHPGKRLSVRITLVDSGGAGIKGGQGANVTARAYEWWRRLRAQGLAQRVALTKGTGSSADARGPLITESYPDNSARTDRHSGARGDVPIYLLNVNALKDALDGDLRRTEPGPGFIHFPGDLPGSVFDELTSEIRTEKGWEIATNAAPRNEGWDQLTMDLAANLLPQDLKGIVRTKGDGHRARFAVPGARIDWSRPPLWAAPPPQNSEVDNALAPAVPGPRRTPPPRPQPTSDGFGKSDWSL